MGNIALEFLKCNPITTWRGVKYVANWHAEMSMVSSGGMVDPKFPKIPGISMAVVYESSIA
jgi:hypothetical protein